MAKGRVQPDAGAGGHKSPVEGTETVEQRIAKEEFSSFLHRVGELSKETRQELRHLGRKPLGLISKRYTYALSEHLDNDARLALLSAAFVEAFNATQDSGIKQAVLSDLLQKIGLGDSLPPPPAELAEMPTDAPALWLDRADRKQTPADFIAREYAPWLGKGLTQAHVRRLDKSLYMALHQWLQKNELPFDLPTQKQMNDRLLQAAGLPTDAQAVDEAQRERMRLHAMVRLRSIRASHKTPEL